jgi:tRNA A37 methylthiotransferase MiaB
MKNQKKYFGRDQYLNSVIVESEKNLTGQLMEIKINNLNHNSLFGTPLFNEKKNYAA